MISQLLSRLLQPLLIAALAIAGVVAIAQTARLSHAQLALDALQKSVAIADTSAQLRAAQTGQEALARYAHARIDDAPVVPAVTQHARAVCVHAADRLPQSAPTGGAGSSDAAVALAADPAPDPADRRRAELIAERQQLEVEFAEAIGGDLALAAEALPRCEAIRQFHNANAGDAHSE